jgi:hypothetical protein
VILSQSEIIERIKSPENGEAVKRAKEIFISHQLHVKGVGVDEFLVKVDNYENEAQLNNRRRTTKPMTVPIFGKELSTYDKAFSAQGFSRYYDIGGENQSLEKDFKSYLNSDLGEGRSLKEWMQDIWKEKVNYDPSGVFMIELPSEMDSRPNPYVVYRSITDIHDIEADGKKVEYVIFVDFKTDKDGEYYEYRIIDDAFDYIAIQRDGNIKIQEDKTLPNKWGYVPCVQLSTQLDSVSEAKTSYIWRAIGVADEYLTDSSIHSVLKKLHGYPIFWMRERGCRTCNGEGKVNGTIAGELIACGSCNGSGMSLKKDVSDGIVIPQLTEAGQVDSLPVAGYEQPDLATLAEQRVELDWLKNTIHLAIWSDDEIVSGEATTNGTATGRMLDVQAIYDKLNVFSSNAEQVEKFLTDAIGEIRYGSVYNYAIINYGRRYFVRSAYEIEELYQKAKTAELPNSILSAYREELAYIKFGNDPIQLSRQLKLMELEPFLDYSVKQVKEIGVSQGDIYSKLYFNDYITRYEQEQKPITFSTIEEIKKKLEEYNNEKVAQQPTQVDTAIA